MAFPFFYEYGLDRISLSCSVFNTLVYPICPLIILSVQIYFLPDSALSSVPFAALKVGDRYLIEKYRVAQGSSLGTLALARAQWDDIRCKASHIDQVDPPEIEVFPH